MYSYHRPVLSQSVIVGLALKSGEHYLDVTVGGGGHSQLILAEHQDIRLTAIDRDQMAIDQATKVLAPYQDRVELWHGKFSSYNPGETKFAGILADLGVSSAQLDIPERGFSFRHNAPLDMRMDHRQDLTAADIINHWSEKDLADIFYKYGEERLSRRIARAIVERRPLLNTEDLASLISKIVPGGYRYGRIHPATRVFQALRIVVNQELDELEKFLELSPKWLKEGGILAIISFHSLEDRIVKHSFRNNEKLSVLTKKPIIADGQEEVQNPRSRSAKLRLAQLK
jgi:16S rRNA (cytosine1402-N4)-methyltransferase